MTVTSAKIIPHVLNTEQIVRLLRISKEIGFSETEVKELGATYQFALEQDCQPELASHIKFYPKKVRA